MTSSTSGGSTPDPGVTWVAVDACTLPTADRPMRVAEFDDLFRTALRKVERPAGDTPRARLILAGDDDVAARVQRLADAETSCCSFFTFTVTELGPEAPGAAARVALDIEVPPTRGDVLDALVSRAAARVSA